MIIRNKRTIDLDFFVRETKYTTSLTVNAQFENGNITYSDVRYNGILFPEYIRIELNSQLENKTHHDFILSKLKTTTYTENNIIEVDCSMLCRIDLYVMDVYCKCVVEMYGCDNFVDVSTIQYSDIYVSCLVESFTHPVEWSLDGDNRNDFKVEWEDIKQTLIDRIHEGFYNYELAYKSLNLVRRMK